MIQFFSQIIQQLSGNGVNPTEGTITPQGEVQLQSADKPTFAQSLFSFLGGREAEEQLDLGPPGSLYDSGHSGLSLFVPPSGRKAPVDDQKPIIPTESLIEHESAETQEFPPHAQVMALIKSQADSFQQPVMQIKVVDTSQFKDTDSSLSEEPVQTVKRTSPLTLVKSASEPVITTEVKANPPIPSNVPVNKGDVVKPMMPSSSIFAFDEMSAALTTKAYQSGNQTLNPQPTTVAPVLPGLTQVPNEVVFNNFTQSPMSAMPAQENMVIQSVPLGNTHVVQTSESAPFLSKLPLQTESSSLLESVQRVVKAPGQSSTFEESPAIVQVKAQAKVNGAKPTAPIQVDRVLPQNQPETTTEEIKIRSSILQVQKSVEEKPTQEVKNSGLVSNQTIDLEEETMVVQKKQPTVRSEKVTITPKPEPVLEKVKPELVEADKTVVKLTGTKPEVNQVNKTTVKLADTKPEVNQAENTLKVAAPSVTKQQSAQETTTNTPSQNQVESTEITVSNFSSSGEFDLGEQTSDKSFIQQESTSILPKEILERKDFPIRFVKALQQQQVVSQRALNTEALKPHTFILDNGDVLNVAAKQTEGILTLQIDARNQDIVKIIQQHSDDIKVHLQKQLDIEIDLQLNDFNKQDGTSEWEKSFQQQGKPANGITKADDPAQTTSEQTTAEEQVKRLGFNNNEWVG